MTSFLISQMLLDMRLLQDQVMSYTSQCTGKISFKYTEKIDHSDYFKMKCVIQPVWLNQMWSLRLNYLFDQPKADGMSAWENLLGIFSRPLALRLHGLLTQFQACESDSAMTASSSNSLLPLVTGGQNDANQLFNSTVHTFSSWLPECEHLSSSFNLVSQNSTV